MKKAICGVVIQLKDLDAGRVFYRDTLGLGEPCFDSSFAVEFLLEDGFLVRLEKSSADYFEPAASPQSWFFSCSCTEELRRKLAEQDIELHPANRSGRDFLLLSDPEGNQILIVEEK